MYYANNAYTYLYATAGVSRRYDENGKGGIFEWYLTGEPRSNFTNVGDWLKFYTVLISEVPSARRRKVCRKFIARRSTGVHARVVIEINDTRCLYRLAASLRLNFSRYRRD